MRIEPWMNDDHQSDPLNHPGEDDPEPHQDIEAWLRIQQTPRSGTECRWYGTESCYVTWWIGSGDGEQSGYGEAASFAEALREAFKYGYPWDDS